MTLVSHRFRFIFLPIGKNASSTLRAELGKERFATSRERYLRLDEAVRRDYFTFTFLRHPVSRFLSAYQEISMRIEGSDQTSPTPAFAALPQGPEHFEAFLRRAENRLWDVHLKPQVDHLDRVRLDFIGRIETLQDDLAAIYDRLDMGRMEPLPHRRSREGRARIYRYDRHWIREEDLDAPAIERIRNLYAEDFELWQRVTEERERLAGAEAADVLRRPEASAIMASHQRLESSMSDERKSKKELLEELEALRRQVADLESAERPPTETEGGEPIFGGNITRRTAVAAWVAPVILSIPVSQRAAGQTAASGEALGPVMPTMMPTEMTLDPTMSPTTMEPTTQSPTGMPTMMPTETTMDPTMSPTTMEPTTQSPTGMPTMMPTETTMDPTMSPTTMVPTTQVPTTQSPTGMPTMMPTEMTQSPTRMPTSFPTAIPTAVPTPVPVELQSFTID